MSNSEQKKQEIPRWGVYGLMFVAAGLTYLLVKDPPKGSAPVVVTPQERPEAPAPAERPRPAPPKPSGVTMAMYEQVKPGLSHEQVVEIFGGVKGEELSSSEIAGMSTVMYKWSGTSLGANCNVMFQNNKMIQKAQFGLR